MKAVVLKKIGKADRAFEIVEREKLIASSNEVLIKVEAFGLNYADVMARNGLYREAPPIPCVLGYEVVGTIENVGENVDSLLIGKRVVAFTRFGGYAEYVVANEFGFVEIDDINVNEALSIATQFVTAYYMSNVVTNLFEGDKVLIHAGAGGVGTALIQLCKLKGCTVFATAGSENKLYFMKELGADYVINYREKDYLNEIKSILGEDRLDATFNPIGGKTFKKDFSLIGSGGRLILFGGSERSGKNWGIFSTLNFVRKMGVVIPIGTMMRSKSIIGVNMLKIGDNRPKTLKFCMKKVVELVKSGKLKAHVGGVFPAEKIAEAHDFLESRNSKGKVTVHW